MHPKNFKNFRVPIFFRAASTFSKMPTTKEGYFFDKTFSLSNAHTQSTTQILQSLKLLQFLNTMKLLRKIYLSSEELLRCLFLFFFFDFLDFFFNSCVTFSSSIAYGRKQLPYQVILNQTLLISVCLMLVPVF